MADDPGTMEIPGTMLAIRLHAPGTAGLAAERVEVPRLCAGEALVRVHAAAITRDELEWPLDRLPAIPSYELSGVVAAIAPDVNAVAVGEPVYALTPFDRDGAAAEYAGVPANVLAPKPATLDHVCSAAIPLAALSAWQGLFDHGALEAEQRVLVLGAAGGVGHLATQLARWRGAYVVGTVSPGGVDLARSLGSDEVLDHSTGRLPGGLEPFQLVFDTVGGELLEQASAFVRPGCRVVSVVEQPPASLAEMGIDARYFVVGSSREQLVEIGRIVDAGALRPAIDSVFPLTDARAAFERSLASGKRGKVVIRVAAQ
jgi:NADPH:quinone reductase-like Zn-dependent oxidoreductase